MFTAKAVILDFFGTLVPVLPLAEHKAVLGDMAAIVGVSPDVFVQQWLSMFNKRVTGGFPSSHANVEAICNMLSVPVESVRCEQAVSVRYAYVRRHIVPRPNAIATLREIRARGLKVGLITDCSSELPELWHETAFAELFDVTVFSCVAKVKKPNPEIYHQAANKLGMMCSECLYVGDGGSNELTGARAVGMHPVLLHMKEEQDDAEAHRVDGELWDGARISDLAEILCLI